MNTHYNFVINPKTGRKVSIYNKLGRNILKNYLLESNMSGGGLFSNILGTDTSSKIKTVKKNTRNIGRNIGNRARSFSKSETGRALRNEALNFGNQLILLQ